jgi:hypothetical protein
MALTVMELVKTLPRTNCGECGQSTCLAFATQVIKEGEDLERCPYLGEAAQTLAGDLKSQQAAGVGRRRESIAIALEALQEKVAPLDFAALAQGVGAAYGEEGDRPYLNLEYFGQQFQVFKDEVRYPEGVEANPWDAILLYNFIFSQGRVAETGAWITFQSLPNSVSKTKTLNRLEKDLAAHFTGRRSSLEAAAAGLRAEPADLDGDADLKLVFRPLPKVPVLLLFWEDDPEEDFPAQAHFLFDGSVPDYLDLESLLFLVEQLADRLMA